MLLVTWACGRPGHLDAPGGSGGVTGVVHGVTSGDPLGGVTVAVEGTRWVQITDEHGRFTMTGMPAKRTRLTVWYLDRVTYVDADVVHGKLAEVALELEETPRAQTCTLRGCSSALWVYFKRAGAFASIPIDDRLRVSGVIDGVPFDCVPIAATAESTPCAGARELRCNAPKAIELTLEKPTTAQGCTTRSLGVLGFMTLPKRVSLTISSGASAIVSETFVAEYESEYPNGKRCGDPCQVSSKEIALR
jgi:hypothetical protein